MQHPAPSGPPEIWGAWLEVGKATALWVASFVLLLAVPTVTALPYFIYQVMVLGAAAAQEVATDKTLIFFYVLGILPAHLLTLAVIWMVVSRAGKRPFWQSIDFGWPENRSPVFITFVCVLLALVLFGFGQFVTYIYGERKTDLDLIIESSIHTRLATAFMAVVTAPLVEEVIYRGVLYRALDKAAGALVAVPLVSVLFAGVHVWQYRNNIAVILVISILSIVLTVSRALSGKMLPAFLIHLAFNGIQSFFIVLGGFLPSR